METCLGAMKLRQVGPAGHGIEAGLALRQFQDCLAGIVWQGRSTCFKHLENSLCITLPACVVVSELLNELNTGISDVGLVK